MLQVNSRSEINYICQLKFFKSDIYLTVDSHLSTAMDGHPISVIMFNVSYHM
jgi:hypothetical protein